MKNDKILLAALLGALSTIPAEIVTRIFTLSGVGKYSIYQADSLIITINRPSVVMGFFISCIIGGISSSLLYLVLQKIGIEHIIIKTAIVSLLLWVLLELIFTFSIEGRFIDIRPVNDYYLHLIGAVIFGTTQGILFKRYLFKEFITHQQV